MKQIIFSMLIVLGYVVNAGQVAHLNQLTGISKNQTSEILKRLWELLNKEANLDLKKTREGTHFDTIKNMTQEQYILAFKMAIKDYLLIDIQDKEYDDNVTGLMNFARDALYRFCQKQNQKQYFIFKSIFSNNIENTVLTILLDYFVSGFWYLGVSVPTNIDTMDPDQLFEQINIARSSLIKNVVKTTKEKGEQYLAEHVYKHVPYAYDLSQYISPGIENFMNNANWMKKHRKHQIMHNNEQTGNVRVLVEKFEGQRQNINSNTRPGSNPYGLGGPASANDGGRGR
jgi:hypothetical protein